MNRFMRRYPSPSLVVSIVALVIALGGAGYSATGGNFILGVNSNTAATQTGLVSNRNGRALAIQNTNTGAAATALSLAVAAGHPPFVTNSNVRVPNLNADRLDGLDSTHFPRRTVISFNLAAGAVSAPIIVPPSRPVFVMGVTTTFNFQGAGHATLLRTGSFIMWTGLESMPTATTASGYSFAAGGHIVYIDYSDQVDIEVNGADTIRIHNGSTVQQTGTVTLIW